MTDSLVMLLRTLSVDLASRFVLRVNELILFCFVLFCFVLFPRFLPPQIQISYQFSLANEKQIIQTLETAFGIGYELRNFKMHLMRIVVDPTISLNVESKLLREPCLYPLYNWRTTSLNVPSGLLSYSCEDVFNQSLLPGL